MGEKEEEKIVVGYSPAYRLGKRVGKEAPLVDVNKQIDRRNYRGITV